MSASTRRRIVLLAAVIDIAVGGIVKASERMSMNDFFLDRRSLIGKSVKIEGNYEVFGDIIFMVLDKGKNATFVDINELPREIRKVIYRDCDKGCSGTVEGDVEVINSSFGADIGIKAKSMSNISH